MNAITYDSRAGHLESPGAGAQDRVFAQLRGLVFFLFVFFLTNCSVTRRIPRNREDRFIVMCEEAAAVECRLATKGRYKAIGVLVKRLRYLDKVTLNLTIRCTILPKRDELPR